MGFTTAAFIRKNTPELRKKLEELGYKDASTVQDNYTAIYTDEEEGEFFTQYLSNITDGYASVYSMNDDDINVLSKKIGSFIDCGTNEELFLAIAALRDDTDENQWFIADSLLSVSYDDTVGNDHYFIEPKGSMFFWDINWMNATIISGNFHKATVEELIEHFKEKEE